MAVEIQDVLKASLVLLGVELLNTQEAVHTFTNAVGAEVSIGTNMLPGFPIPFPNIPGPSAGGTITIDRDRIVIETSPARTMIAKDYPSHDDLNRLSEVAGHAIEQTEGVVDQPLRAIGYNIELVYDQTSTSPSIRYLAERLFTADMPSNEGWQLAGGTGRLTFDDTVGRRWNISLEPRLNDQETTRIFMSVNAHQDNPRLPHKDEIKRYFQEAWQQAHDFMNKLDASK